jgi:predicted ArsR family transcriptional regulator
MDQKSPEELRETIQKLKEILQETSDRIEAIEEQLPGNDQQEPSFRDIISQRISMKYRQGPGRTSVMSRRKIEEVWDALPDKASFAKTTSEISRDLGMNESVAQRALYVLLSEGRAKRQQREGDKKGRPSWEYYRLNVPSPEPIDSAKIRFDMDAFFAAIPKSKEDAKSIRELARAIEGSPITVRQKIQQLEAAEKVVAQSASNERNQPVKKYYLKNPQKSENTTHISDNTG